MANLRAMKEHSQIADMRAAVRGDIERSRARRAATRVAEPEPPRREASEPTEELPRRSRVAAFLRLRF